MLIDPRKFITGPFRPCPKCGKPEFGTFHVGDHHISRQCRECRHAVGEHLPPLSKRIVYLDQMILSNMAKTLDPEWGKQRPQQDGYWATAFDALDRALERETGPAHMAKVAEVYGESWLTPYRSILEHERDRQAKRKAQTPT